MNLPDLTPRQRTIYDHLRARAAEGAPPPTLDGLCKDLGLRSRGSMHKQVQALIAAGLVEPMQGRQRGIRLRTEPDAPDHALPLLGRIAAGRPIEAIPDSQTISVPPSLRTQRPCYVLEVRGDSMIEDGILDGDWVVVERCEQARNGAIVVALIDGTEATLKRIEQRPGEVRLHPANSALSTQVYAPERVEIQGVLVGQMRRYR